MPINVYRKYEEVIGNDQGSFPIGTNRERYFEIPKKKAGQKGRPEDQERQNRPYNKKEDLLIRAKGCSLYVKDGVVRIVEVQH